MSEHRVEMEVHVVEMEVHVAIEVNNREAIERITGPDGNEWRSMFYSLETEEEVLEHWAYNAIHNGCTDASKLDGWADLEEGEVKMYISHVGDL